MSSALNFEHKWIELKLRDTIEIWRKYKIIYEKETDFLSKNSYINSKLTVAPNDHNKATVDNNKAFPGQMYFAWCYKWQCLWINRRI